jgi:hypothetical protein
MNWNTLTKNFSTLTPEERFRLIFAASGRGDEAERDRLVNAAPRLTLTMPAYSPFAHAFQELSLLTYIELLDDAAFYGDANEQASEALGNFEPADAEGEESGDKDKGNVSKEESTADIANPGSTKPPLWVRSLEVAYAAGYMLRTKADGWKLFCERLNVSPWLLLEDFPGFDRLQRALALTEQTAFKPEGFLRWLNVVRPAGAPELTRVPLTVEVVANATAEMYRARAAWWSGE